MKRLMSIMPIMMVKMKGCMSFEREKINNSHSGKKQLQCHQVEDLMKGEKLYPLRPSLIRKLFAYIVLGHV
jgi:hypothetical protein